MSSHVFLPETVLDSIQLHSDHDRWLATWETALWEDTENGSTATSLCLLGVLNELLRKRQVESDWIGILDEYLTDANRTPLAYSEEYGTKLFKFNQWRQSPVHAIHGHWWIRKTIQPSEIDHEFYAQLIIDRIQPSGWIYDPAVSCTGTTTRMKSELTMSVCMAIEVMNSANKISEYAETLQSSLSALPPTGYLSAEYFRIASLEQLNSLHLATTQQDELFASCRAGHSYCDFSLAGKVDDYMGTAKRTSRDQALESPLSTLHALHCVKSLNSSSTEDVIATARDYARVLDENPLDIPAFRMRDLEPLFGPGVTPLELMAASSIVNMFRENS